MFLTPLVASADERAASQVFARLRSAAQREAFLRAFPKGGDLHTHLTGAVPPEKLIEIARRRGFCVDPQQVLLFQNAAGSCPTGQLPSGEMRDGSDVYRRLIDGMSMAGYRGPPEGRHKHFFQAFRFRVLDPEPLLGELLEDVVVRAAAQNVSYLEQMFFPFRVRQTAELAQLLRHGAEFAEWLDRLRGSEQLRRYVDAGGRALDAAEEHLRRRRSREAAAVERRYIVNVSRVRKPENVFAQLLATADLAMRDKRVVGVNLVAAEDHPVARRDFRLHMRMLDFLVARYPAMRVTLHAGELVPRLLAAESKPGRVHEDLTFHIGESVWTGRAERIGHGSSLRYERDRAKLLAAMRDRGIAVEIALTSEEIILGLKGRENPLLDYRVAGVPVLLATDDEGVLDTDLTREFARAARDYFLDYRALKELARNSIAYSFLPGATLFRARSYDGYVPACAGAEAPAEPPSSCREFLANNPKAAAQFGLERQFAEFESATSLRGFRASEPKIVQPPGRQKRSN